MKASELRIGNYVDLLEGFSTHNDTIIVSVENIGWHDEFTPIPLTEKWLVKFGFDKIKYIEEDYEWFEYTCKTNSNFFKYITIDEDFNLTLESDYDSIKTIKHIHELQNLYFALTKEELTIK